MSLLQQLSGQLCFAAHRDRQRSQVDLSVWQVRGANHFDISWQRVLSLLGLMQIDIPGSQSGSRLKLAQVSRRLGSASRNHQGVAEGDLR